jgi:hypothetical protein
MRAGFLGICVVALTLVFGTAGPIDAAPSMRVHTAANGDHFIRYAGHDYRLYTPRSGIPLDRQTLREFGEGLSDGFDQTMCAYTFGYYKEDTYTYVAMEGILSKGLSAIDALSAPEGYTVRVFQSPVNTANWDVVVPRPMAAAIERLGSRRNGTFFTDYSVVFLIKRRGGCGHENRVVEFIPVGKSFDGYAFAADAVDKSLAAAQLISLLRGRQ